MTLPKSKDSKIWRDSYYHRLFGLRAAQEAERLLPAFEKERPADARPRKAVEAIAAWAAGKRALSMGEVRKLSLGCRAIESTINKCKKVRPKLRVGTAQDTLLRRRIKAFGVASVLIKRELQETRE